MKILHIDASASDAETSHTRRLSGELIERLKAADPDATIVYRDVVADQLPHVDMTIRHAWLPENDNDPTLAETGRRSKAPVDELSLCPNLTLPLGQFMTGCIHGYLKSPRIIGGARSCVRHAGIFFKRVWQVGNSSKCVTLSKYALFMCPRLTIPLSNGAVA